MYINDVLVAPGRLMCKAIPNLMTSMVSIALNKLPLRMKNDVASK